jgi:transposase
LHRAPSREGGEAFQEEATMENTGLNESLERLLGLEGLRVRGASLQPHGLVVQVRVRLPARRCGLCGDFWPGYDISPVRQWRHVALERTPVWLSCAPRRVECPQHGVRVERVPWAAHGARFTTELEQMMPWLCRRIGLRATHRMMGCSWRTAERLLHRPVLPLPDLRRIEEHYVIGTDTLSLRHHSQDLAAVLEQLGQCAPRSPAAQGASGG